MSTNSTIGIENLDGTIELIYCHWDGYLEHNGRILQQHYTQEHKVRELVALGDLSVLGDETGAQVDFNDRDTHGSQCVAYGRDRGETEVSSVTYANREMVAGLQEFNYLWSVSLGSWSVNTSSNNVWSGLSRQLALAA